MKDLPVTTADRGFDHHAPVTSRHGGEVRVSESGDTAYPGLWLHTICPEPMSALKSIPGEDRAGVEVSANLHVDDAWQLARQLAATVIRHYQGDARPDAAIEGARSAIVQMTGWSPAMADTLLRKLRHAGFVMLDVGAGEPGDDQPDVEAESPYPAKLLDAEPEDGALVVYVKESGSLEVDTIRVRDDNAARAGGYESGDHWFPVATDDSDEEDGYPSSWRTLTRDGQPVARLYPHQVMEPGVKARLEWAVHSSASDTIYSVRGGDHDTAIREATLLAQGVDGDPVEPGAAPASRYVLDTPRGRIEGPWSWPMGWTPPPAELLG